MKAYIDCVHCYLKQAASCMAFAHVDEDRQHQVIYELMDFVKGMDRRNTPAENSTEALLEVYKKIANDDPYKEAKKSSNDLALKLYPALKDLLEDSEDRLYSALKISVAGNIIDLGINKSFDIQGSLQYSLKTGFAKDDYRDFLGKLQKAKEVVIIGDNAGEIVFDRILVEELTRRGKKVIYVVKEGPILNDSTMEDAFYVGMDKVARVITTGSRYLGVSFNHISQEFLSLLQNSELIISKGQANFETLEDQSFTKGRIYYLLKIKCEGVGRVAGVNFGDIVFFNK
ncbi:ARMT1-like domain-containing protein [Desulforamulus ruminis]|uniref:damage-control phosphatase ARMT1 family protein n=1 Tax=Desulforamulus ruminis TaxID=1564 RepID=UPI002FDADBA7